MELKTKFSIGDKVYYIDTSRNSGIIVDEYKIESIDVTESIINMVKVTYNIYNCRMSHDRHSVSEDDIYSLDDIDNVLENIKTKLKGSDLE